MWTVCYSFYACNETKSSVVCTQALEQKNFTKIYVDCFNCSFSFSINWTIAYTMVHAHINYSPKDTNKLLKRLLSQDSKVVLKLLVYKVFKETKSSSVIFKVNFP